MIAFLRRLFGREPPRRTEKEWWDGMAEDRRERQLRSDTTAEEAAERSCARSAFYGPSIVSLINDHTILADPDVTEERMRAIRSSARAEVDRYVDAQNARNDWAALAGAQANNIHLPYGYLVAANAKIENVTIVPDPYVWRSTAEFDR